MHACIIESPSVVRSINRMTKEFGETGVFQVKPKHRLLLSGCLCYGVSVVLGCKCKDVSVDGYLSYVTC
jgi:hypothetical protein